MNEISGDLKDRALGKRAVGHDQSAHRTWRDCHVSRGPQGADSAVELRKTRFASAVTAGVSHAVSAWAIQLSEFGLVRCAA